MELVASASDEEVALTWQAPEDDGGAPITEYEYRFAEGSEPPSNAVWTSVGPDRYVTVPSLLEGHLYTFEVRAINRVGSGPAASATAKTSVPNPFSSAMMQGWLARFGRTASANVIEAIRQRMEENSQRSQLIVGGTRVYNLQSAYRHLGNFARSKWIVDDKRLNSFLKRAREPGRSSSALPHMLASGGGAGIPDPGESGLAHTTAPVGNTGVSEPGASSRSDLPRGLGYLFGSGSSARAFSKNRPDLLTSSSFLFTKVQNNESETARTIRTKTLWGRAATTLFNAEIESLQLEGEVITGMMGLDLRRGRWLTGIVASYSEGTGDFREEATAIGKINSSLTGLYPYMHFRSSQRTSFWGTLGYGTGRLRLMLEEESLIGTTTLSNSMAAFGGRGVLSAHTGEAGHFELALNSDAMWTHTTAEAVAGLGDTAGSTGRVRLMLEGTGSIPLTDNMGFIPTLEGGLRYDAGDAERGTGFEVGGGLAWSSGGLTLQASGRRLLAHQDEAYKEWGYGGSIQYDSGGDGNGLNVSLASARGQHRSGVQKLWASQDNMGRKAYGRMPDSGRNIRLNLGYKLQGRRDRTPWHPYLGVETFGNSGRALNMGLKVTRGRNMDANFEFGRRESAMSPPEQTVQLRTAIRW